jgi:hypothetical protein
MEKVRYTSRPTNGVMQLQPIGGMHDEARSHPCALGSAENHIDAPPEGAMARTLRHRTAAVQPALPSIRLAYRIQELAYGGLKPETIKRLEALGEQLDGGDKRKRGIRANRDRPINGTRLLREWQGVEQIVTVTQDGLEWQGRPYQSLSAIARAITGTRWNGWVFFGLKNHRRTV